MTMRRAVLMMACLALAACQTTGDAAKGTAPQGIAGSAAHVPPSTIERSRQDFQHDDDIQSQALRKVRGLAPTPAYRAVTIEVWNGTALLMGAVIKPEQRRRAEQNVAALPGVRKVLNELVLAEDRALDLFIPNAAMEGSVRQTLGLDGSSGVTVRVLNKVVFLLGGVADKAEAERLREDAGEVDGIKWVVAHLSATP